MSTGVIPTEYEEQCTLVQWMEYKGLKFTAIPNSTWTRSIQQKVKNTKSGLRKGFPDLVIIIPNDKSNTGKSELVFIEMKRSKGGRLSEEQKEWIEALEEAEQHVFVCKGCDTAIEVLEMFIK